MNKHQLRTKRKEQEILSAAVELVGNIPLQHITINLIKEKARVSQVTIYKLFYSKENLINEAILKITRDTVTEVNKFLNSNLSATERLKGYLTTAFNTAIKYPQQKNLRDYIFSSIDLEFKADIKKEYDLTMSPLLILYNDCINEKIIRNEITFNKFIEFLDMVTKIDPIFYSDEESLNLLLDGFIRFFS